MAKPHTINVEIEPIFRAWICGLYRVEFPWGTSLMFVTRIPGVPALVYTSKGNGGCHRISLAI